MATRIYLPSGSDLPAPITPTADGAWDKASGAQTPREATVSPQGTSATSASNSENAATPQNVLVYRYVYGPLKAQTISGTLKGQTRCYQSNAAADFRIQLVVRVVAPDGVTVRGTLWAADTEELSSEFHTSARNITIPLAALSPAALTPVEAQDGDFLAIEIGFRAHNTATTWYYGYIHNGEPGASDLPEDETTTAALNPWIEFSQDLETYQVRVGQVVGEALYLQRSPLHQLRVRQVVGEVLWEPVSDDATPRSGVVMLGGSGVAMV